jgi:regulatory protein YycI of two-component signal transduction system YycFG
MYNGMRSDAELFSSLYFIAWIFIGNFILLNLFLAILLENITSEKNEQDAEIDEEVEEELEKI